MKPKKITAWAVVVGDVFLPLYDTAPYLWSTRKQAKQWLDDVRMKDDGAKPVKVTIQPVK